MVQAFKAALLGAVILATASYAQLKQDCGIGFGKCPSEKPCCSQYGQCGIGGFCLGGCDPKYSNQVESCVSAPVCKSQDYTFGNLDRVADKTKFLGDSSRYDWVVDGKPRIYSGNLLLTMEPKTVGTVLASTAYVWYGNIKVTMKTSRGKGVVTAFILMSDMKDEIDFEWVGVDLDTSQTNYYFQGIPDYNHGGKIKTPNTFSEWHTYEIDWKEDSLTWKVDGQVGRTLKKSDTYNSTTKNYDYPQTPSRIQLSLWPGGLATNGEGTIAWAGGEIDWVNHPDIKDPGYYYATIKDVSVECYDPPSDAQVKGSKSYYYDDAAGLEKNVVISDKGTVLQSFLGSGTNMSATLPSGSSSLDNIETVPGLTGAGTGAAARANQSDSSTSSTDQGITSNSGSNTFSQGDSSSKNDATTARVLQGSMLAIVVAVAGILVL
ncbi:family 16 glycosyl hydrolase [Wilcoxina mikolae CBS 423.85]|nr:family 16 glycosyl hydrolase [Wilcoxina mikolae CBS 423.85]